MVTTSTIRVVTWAGGVVVAGGAFGMAWATQPIEVPVWAVLVLTFVPTSDLIDVVQELLEGTAEKFGAENRK